MTGYTSDRRALSQRLGALTLAGIVAWTGSLWSCQPRAEPAPMRTVPLTSWEGSELQPALSPSGDRVAFVWDGEVPGRYDLYAMTVGTGEPQRLTKGPGQARHPVWSPDGAEIAFLQEAEEGPSRVMAVAAEGGSPSVLTSVSGIDFSGLDWSPDSRWLAVVDSTGPELSNAIFLLSLESGEKQTVTAPPSGGVGDRNPVFSPDGRTLAFVRWYEAPRTEIHLVELGDGEPRILTRHEGWIRGLDWMPDSSALVFSSYWMGTTGLWRVSTRGQVSPLPIGKDATGLSIASAGDRLVVSQGTADCNIWRIGGPTAEAPVAAEKLIASDRDDWGARFSPDGDRIAFTSDRSGVAQIWLANSHGHDQSHFATRESAIVARWSPDGQSLTFGQETAGDADVFVASVDGGSPRRLTVADSTDAPWDWSRDGEWIYFFSDRTGSYQIWKVPSAGGEPLQITRHGGLLPTESDDGRLVFYMKMDPPSIWKVPVDGGEESLVLEGWGLSRSGFTVWRQSLVYLVDDGDEGPRIERFDLDSGQSEPIAVLGPDTRIGKYGRISVSPDGRWILFPRDDSPGSDLLLVENFR